MLEIGAQFLPDISVFHITEYNHIHQMVIYELPVAVAALRLTKQKIRKFSPASSSTPTPLESVSHSPEIRVTHGTDGI